MFLELELELDTPGISQTKVCPVNEPMYSKVTCDKMSPSCDFIFILRYSFENWHHYVIV